MNTDKGAAIYALIGLLVFLFLIIQAITNKR